MNNQVHLENLGGEESFKNDLTKEATKMIDHRAEFVLLAACPKLKVACKNLGEFEKQRRSGSDKSPHSSNSFLYFYNLIVSISLGLQVASAQQAASFPGVSRDLASFCSARPSLSIELASMVVHVKRATSFNYKLYLFSYDNYVFQTGQIVPRDDFRVHSFPVKLKPFNEFLPADVATFQQTSAGNLAPVTSGRFNAKAFFAQVPVAGAAGSDWSPQGKKRSTQLRQQQHRESKRKEHRVEASPLFDVLDAGASLPGDEATSTPFGHHDAALAQERQAKQFAAPNSNVQFDRDDQVALLGVRKAAHSASLVERRTARRDSSSDGKSWKFASNRHMVMPVGAFSSFHVNTTYLVRKDFDQLRPELVRLQIDPHKFVVTQVHLLDMLKVENGTSVANGTQVEELAFLNHKLLRDPNTRITSVNQIYEDWITRNFYTIVYIQRRLEAPERSWKGAQASGEQADEMDESLGGEARRVEEADSQPETLIVTDRLVFRGSSLVLLGADQLDYEVKASAFITEKNGLHYYFEFLTQGKFYLGAIDWSRRPFAIIDAQRFPVRQTKTKFDNEELLLCPPSVCYSERPIDELVSYGRLGLAEKQAREAAVLTRALSSSGRPRELFSLPNGTQLARPNRSVDEKDHELRLSLASGMADKQSQQQQRRYNSITEGRQMQRSEMGEWAGEMISLDQLVESVRAAASHLELRLHLRDWIWSMPRMTRSHKLTPSASSLSRLDTANKTTTTDTSRAANDTDTESPTPMSAFAWHFEWARRNDVKLTSDNYGFVLTGHEIEASYRVYDELHLISANQLIIINYTLANETVTSVQRIDDEFQGLSSSFLDPITGAFYDRYANQLYFFKGDRYVGYDYATKRPLEDFLLPAAVDSLHATPLVNSAQETLGEAGTPAAATRRQLAQPLVSSLPVVGILGRQHYVDAVWHDLYEDLVYVFSGAKFYYFQASDFKDGAFRGARQPTFRCINEHFLEGCRFDEAFPNPCHDSASIRELDEANEVEVDANQRAQAASNSSTPRTTSKKMKLSELAAGTDRGLEFDEEQQMKLRAIATRGNGAGLLDALLDNTLAGAIGDGTRSGVEPFLVRAVSMPGMGSTPQERIVIYLLIAMVLITIVVTVAMIFVILSWGRARARASLSDSDAATEKLDESKSCDSPDQQNGPRFLDERISYPPAIRQYLSKQYDHYRLQQPTSYQHQYARRQQVPLNYIGGSTGLYRRDSQPPQPPQSQLFQSLNRMAKAATSSPNQAPTRRFVNILDSSAL